MAGPKGSARSVSRKPFEKKEVTDKPESFAEFVEPSREEVARHQKLQADSIIGEITEIVGKSGSLAAIEDELGFTEGDEFEEGEVVFSPEEEEAYRNSIQEYGDMNNLSVEKHGETCRFFMRNLKAQKMFKVYYVNWVVAYTVENPGFDEKKNKNDPDFQLYIRDKGAEYIKGMTKLMVQNATTHFVEENSEEDISEDDFQEKVQKLDESIYKFVTDEKWREKMMADNEADKNEAYAKFKDILDKHGFADIDENKKGAYFDKLIITVTYESLSIEEYETLYDVMVNNVDVSEEEWEKALEDALKKHPEVEEAIKEQEDTVSTYGGTAPVKIVNNYTEFEGLGRNSGVYFAPVGNGVYEINAPGLKGKSNAPRLRIRMVDNRFFDIQMPYGGKNEVYNGDKIDNKRTKRFKHGELQAVINRQMLDFVLNADIDVRQSAHSGETPNDVINDVLMSKIAKNLTGFELNEKPLNKTHLKMFERLMRIILKKTDDNRGLNLRVRDLNRFIVEKSNAAVMRKVLSKPGAVAFNIDTFIKRVKDVRMGKMGKWKGE